MRGHVIARLAPGLTLQPQVVSCQEQSPRPSSETSTWHLAINNNGQRTTDHGPNAIEHAGAEPVTGDGVHRAGDGAAAEGPGQGRRRAGDRRQPVPEHARTPRRPASGRSRRTRPATARASACPSSAAAAARFVNAEFGYRRRRRERRRRLGGQAVRAVFRRGRCSTPATAS